jgi:hypothetical protein
MLGHYTSCVERNGSWWYMDDEKAKNFDIKNRSNSDTDCLFMRKSRVKAKKSKGDQISFETPTTLIEKKKQKSKKIDFESSQNISVKKIREETQKIFNKPNDILHENYGCVVNYFDLGRLLSGRTYSYMMFLNSEVK